MLLKMPQKLLKTAHYIELGSYQHWPVLIPQRIRLYTYEQIPLFLKENPYITDGYRAHLPSKLCLKRCEDFFISFIVLMVTTKLANTFKLRHQECVRVRADLLQLVILLLLFCCSIFILSNETVNIWSHLLGFLLFFLLGVNDLSSILPTSGANREDYVIYAIGLFCFQVYMLCLYRHCVYLFAKVTHIKLFAWNLCPFQTL